MIADPQLRRRQVYGLVILAMLVLLFGVSRSSFHELFPPGWWRIW